MLLMSATKLTTERMKKTTGLGPVWEEGLDWRLGLEWGFSWRQQEWKGKRLYSVQGGCQGQESSPKQRERERELGNVAMTGRVMTRRLQF